MDEKYQKLFWEKVNKTSGCWLWTGAFTEKGYGVAWDGKRTQKAHRVSYMLKHGRMPTQCVLHKCDVPNCVNPDHLFVGTRLENNRDMIQKGRRVVGGTHSRDGYKVGEEHSGSRLTEGDIKSIREEYASGTTSYSRLSAAYGLSIGHTYRIVNRKAWKHVE
jgi:hypothetical protein